MLAISVIIPVFNSALHIRECLESILAQTFQNFEVILVDDGSTDSSWSILLEYSQRDSRFSAYQQQNCGSGPARNAGMARASGKYFLFCDSDDAYPPYAFQVLFTHAEKHGADVACGNIVPMDADLRYYYALDSIHMALIIKEQAVVHRLEHPSLWWPLYHPKFLIASSLLAANGIVYPALRRGQDPVFLARVLCAAKAVVILPHTVYQYRIVKKNNVYEETNWLEYLEHFSATLDIFISAGHIKCACLFYVLSIPAWHNFAQWRRLSKKGRAEERSMFAAYMEKISPYSPWEQDYTPYPVESEKWRKRESFYLKYGHGLSCLHMVCLDLIGKAVRIFSRLKSFAGRS